MYETKGPGLHKYTEILLNNAVDKDLQAMLRPLNLMQNIYCNPKYRIRDNFITPNGIHDNIISLCGVIVSLVICISNTALASYYNRGLDYNTNLYFGGMLNVVLSAIGFIINFWVSVSESNHNVQLVLRLQTTYRKMDCIKKDVKIVSYYHWFNVIALYLSGIVLYIYHHLYFHYTEIHDVVFEVIVICFDMNMLYAILIMKLIIKSIVHWHKEMRTQNGKFANLSQNQIFELYMNVMLTYRMFKETFQRLILFHTVGTFLHALIYVQVIIEIAKINQEKDVTSVTSTLAKLLTWLLKNVILQVALGVECERFYIQVHEVDSTCIMAIATTDYSDNRKNLYKNIIRVNQTSFNKMDACGMFTIDAGSILRLFGSIATYVIILLQFAYL